jgi:hypothetical protein
MPNTSSTALTMALKKVFSGMENRAQHSASGRCRKTGVPARDLELGRIDGFDESRQSTISGPDRQDLSISSEQSNEVVQSKEVGQEIVWVEE